MRPPAMRMAWSRSPWVDVLGVCAGVAVTALILNVPLPGELDGGVQVLSFIRKTLSKVVSSGTAWAAVSVYAGWRVRRPLLAAAGGIGAPLVTLFLHYTLGSLLRIYDFGEAANNQIWFLAALVLGAPLGLCGACCARPSWVGLLARLVVPAGAILEPFLLGKLTPPEIFGRLLPWPERYSDIVSGVVLIVLGVMGGAFVLFSGARSMRSKAPRPRT